MGNKMKKAKRVIKAAQEKGLKLSVAESCTGGMVGAALSSVSGASSVFMGGIISYDNKVKINLLKVSKTDLAKYGAVSKSVAKQMAIGAKKACGADIAVSITGIAGPTGGSVEKPVGTVWIGIANHNNSQAKLFKFEDAGRKKIRKNATKAALDLLFEALEKA